MCFSVVDEYFYFSASPFLCNCNSVNPTLGLYVLSLDLALTPPERPTPLPVVCVSGERRADSLAMSKLGKYLEKDNGCLDSLVLK